MNIKSKYIMGLGFNLIKFNVKLSCLLNCNFSRNSNGQTIYRIINRASQTKQYDP